MKYLKDNTYQYDKKKRLRSEKRGCDDDSCEFSCWVELIIDMICTFMKSIVNCVINLISNLCDLLTDYAQQPEREPFEDDGKLKEYYFSDSETEKRRHGPR